LWTIALYGGLICGALLRGAIAEETTAPDSAPDYGRLLTGDEKIDALQMISLSLRANIDQLSTWSGTYEFVDQFYFHGEVPKQYGSRPESATLSSLDRLKLLKKTPHLDVNPGMGFWVIQTGILEFSVDNKRHRYRGFYDGRDLNAAIDAKSGNETSAPDPAYLIHWIFTPEHAIEFNTADRRGQIDGFPPVATVPQHGGRVLYRRPFNTGKRSSFRNIDVRDFFNPVGRPSWENCDALVKWLRGEGPERSQKFARENEALYTNDASPPVITEVTHFDNTGRQLIVVYDGAVGFHVTKTTIGIKGGTEHQITLSYERHDGIFIPAKYDYQQIARNEGAVSATDFRSFDLVKCDVNEPIPDSEFEIARLPLEYGDRMLDEIQSTLSVFDGRNFVPAADFQPDPSRLPKEDQPPVANAPLPVEPQPRERGVKWLFVINAALIAIGIGWYLFSRGRSIKK
jgi:hypothetical protein